MSTPGELLEALGRQARARLGNGGAVRTYRGRSVEELIPVIERELGAEAIVVRRREGLTGGVLGFFQHPYVEIEAMPGQPAVDVYDEDHSAAPEPAVAPAQPQPFAVQHPPAQPPPLTTEYPPAQLQPLAIEHPPAEPPPLTTEHPPAQPPPITPTTPPLLRRPAYAPVPPAAPEPRGTASQSEEPASRLRVPPLAEDDAAASTASPSRHTVGAEPPAPAASTGSGNAAGSAYVTAHLAALARAGRSSGSTRSTFGPREVREDRVGGGGAAGPTYDPLGEVPREHAYGRAPSEPATRQTRSGPRQPPVAPPLWSSDFQEIGARELSELIPRPVDPIRASASPSSGERRVVAPGSHARARAGVAKGLQRYGISEELAHELIDGATAHALALAPRAGMAQAVRSTLAQRIPVASPLPTKGAAIVVVGAGGAGKTTCCAALLGAYRKSSSLPARFATITREPARVGAAETERAELRVILSPYIMKPTTARTPRALRALRRARGEGMAVLDTPRLSPADRAGIRELAGLLAELKPERVVVALPATLGSAAAAQLLHALRPLGANSLAITHADETDQIGVAVEAACAFGLAPEYVLDRGRGGGWRLSRVDPAGLAARLLP